MPPAVSERFAKLLDTIHSQSQALKSDTGQGSSPSRTNVPDDRNHRKTKPTRHRQNQQEQEIYNGPQNQDTRSSRRNPTVRSTQNVPSGIPEHRTGDVREPQQFQTRTPDTPSQVSEIGPAAARPASTKSPRILHYHLLFQNCDRLEIHVDRSRQGVRERVMHSSDGRNLKRLSWIEGPLVFSDTRHGRLPTPNNSCHKAVGLTPETEISFTGNDHGVWEPTPVIPPADHESTQRNGTVTHQSGAHFAPTWARDTTETELMNSRLSNSGDLTVNPSNIGVKPQHICGSSNAPVLTQEPAPPAPDFRTTAENTTDSGSNNNSRGDRSRSAERLRPWDGNNSNAVPTPEVTSATRREQRKATSTRLPETES